MLSLFDRHWTPDITREQAIDLMRKGAIWTRHNIACIATTWSIMCSFFVVIACFFANMFPAWHQLCGVHCMLWQRHVQVCCVPNHAGVEEVKERLVVAPPKFLAKIVDGTGIQVVGDM